MASSSAEEMGIKLLPYLNPVEMERMYTYSGHIKGQYLFPKKLFYQPTLKP